MCIDLNVPLRLWIHRKTFKSLHILNIPGSVPSPYGRGLG